MPASKIITRLVHDSHLSPQRAKFVEEYITNGFNATKAAIAVGYKVGKSSRQMGSHLSNLPEIRIAITQVLAERGATAERVIDEYLRIAFDHTAKAKMDDRLHALDKLAQFTRAIEPDAIAGKTLNVLAVGDSAVAGLLQAIQSRRPTLPAGEVNEVIEGELVETVDSGQYPPKTASQDAPGSTI